MRHHARFFMHSLAVSAVSICCSGVALAQETTPPASAAFPAEAPAPATAAPPGPAPLPPAPSSAAAPAYPQQPYQAAAPPPYPQAQYQQDPNAQATYGGYPPPPPPEDPDSGFKMPEISVRVDPFNWLLEGRLGLELETQLWHFVTLEFVPVFVTSKSPPTLKYASYNSNLTQSSNGIGAIAGTAVDVAFWFDGKPFRGYALRTGFTNYAYTYNSDDVKGPIDQVSHTEREFFAMLADSSRWGAFTIGGGIGIGYELNKQTRCLDPNKPDCSAIQLSLDRTATNVGEVSGWLYPFDLMARFSLGVVF